jgi:hypothetical protein
MVHETGTAMFADSRSHSIDSLWKLHHKATAIDNYFDARIEPDTSRAAWNEVRDNVERGTSQHNLQQDLRLISVLETQAREAFLNTLTIDIINPLTALKVSDALLAGLAILDSSLSKRKRKTAHENGSKKISRIPPRTMPTMLRTPSPSSSGRTSRNAKISR